MKTFIASALALSCLALFVNDASAIGRPIIRGNNNVVNIGGGGGAAFAARCGIGGVSAFAGVGHLGGVNAALNFNRGAFPINRGLYYGGLGVGRSFFPGYGAGYYGGGYSSGLYGYGSGIYGAGLYNSLPYVPLANGLYLETGLYQPPAASYNVNAVAAAVAALLSQQQAGASYNYQSALQPTLVNETTTTTYRTYQMVR